MRYLLVAGALIAVLSVIFLVPRESRHASGGQYPRAPTAVEEGGAQETGGPPEQTKVSGPTITPERPQSPASSQRPVPRGEVHAAPSWPLLPPESGVLVPSGTREIRTSEDRAGQTSPERDQAAEKPEVPLNAAAQAPVLTAPVLLTPVAGYPAEGYRMELDRSILTARLRVEAAQGRVVLRILVRSDGSVGQVKVVESSGSPVLDDAAVRAATSWTFAPATRDGQPVEAWAIIPIQFVVP